MFEERNQTCGDTDHLARTNVDVADLIGRHPDHVVVESSHHAVFGDYTVLHRRICRSDVNSRFLVSTQPFHFFQHLAVLHHAVRGNQESVIVDLGENTEARNQTDVRTFRRFNRTDSAVVRDMNVAHFEASSLPVQTARTESTQAAFVRQRGERIRLVHNLRQFASTEEVFDRCGNTLRVDQGPRSHFLHVLQAHTFLNCTSELQEAFANFFGRKFIDGSQSAITEVIDVVDMGTVITDSELDDVADRVDHVFCLQRHFAVGDRLVKFPVDSETSNATEAISVHVVELFLEQLDSLFELWRIAWAEPLVNSQQRIFVCAGGVFQDARKREKVIGLLDYFYVLEARSTNFGDRGFGQLIAQLRDDFADAFVSCRIDDIFSGMLANERFVSLADLDRLGFIEQLDEGFA